MKSWYTLTMKATAAEGAKSVLSLSILDDIGGWGVTALDFVHDLTAQIKSAADKGAPAGEIDMTVNSVGGSVFDGLAMYNALRLTGLNITGTVLGLAASAATLPLMAAHKIKMPKNSFLMVHDPSVGMYGNATEMRDIADTLDTIGASLVNTYAARTGKTPEDVKAMLAKETWMSADEALANGFCNEVLPLMEVTALANVNDYSQKIQDAYAKAVAMNPKADMTPEEIAAKEAADKLAADNAAKAAAEAKAKEEADAKAILDAAALKIAMGTTLAQNIKAYADKAGLGEYTAALVLDAKITTPALAEAAVTELVEIKALCDVVSMADSFKDLANARVSLTEARTKLMEARAKAADKTNINGNITNPDNKTVVNNPLDTQAIYAGRTSQPKKEK